MTELDIGALRLKVLKETWEQRLDKQSDGSWRGPAVRVIQEAELISIDFTMLGEGHDPVA